MFVIRILEEDGFCQNCGFRLRRSYATYLLGEMKSLFVFCMRLRHWKKKCEENIWNHFGRNEIKIIQFYSRQNRTEVQFLICTIFLFSILRTPGPGQIEKWDEFGSSEQSLRSAAFDEKQLKCPKSGHRLQQTSKYTRVRTSHTRFRSTFLMCTKAWMVRRQTFWNTKSRKIEIK